MSEVKIDNGYVEVYEMGALRCRVMGGANVSEADVTVSGNEVRITSGGGINVYDLDGALLRRE